MALEIVNDELIVGVTRGVWEGGYNLYVKRAPNFGYEQIASINTYDRFVRFRESEGRWIFESSDDGSTYENRHSIATPPGEFRVRFFAGTYRRTNEPGSCVFGPLNPDVNLRCSAE